MAKGKRRVTAAEVARHSGVSQATVSYVLNDTPSQSISQATRDRVLRSVDELGYSPFEAARTLRSGHSRIVLFSAPAFPVGYVLEQLYDRLTGLLTRQGRTLLTHRNSSEVGLLDVARSLQPLAVISMTPLDPPVRAALDEMGIRVEIIGFREPTGSDDPDVTHPQERVGRLQAEYLTGRGHRRLGYALSADERDEPFAAPRRDAVQEYCAQHGLPAPVLVTVPVELSAAAAAVRLWRTREVTAVCAATDDVALSVIGGARAAGVSVPGELAVIGVDDIPLAGVAVPALTTVHLDVDAMARELVRPFGVLDDEPRDPREQAWIVERASA